MRTLVCLVCICCGWSVFAQNIKSGTIHYEIKKNNNKPISIERPIGSFSETALDLTEKQLKNLEVKSRDIMAKMHSQSDGMVLTLKFNTAESIFYFEEELHQEFSNFAKSFTKTIVGGGKYYYHINQDIIINEKSYQQKYKITKTSGTVVAWRATDEVKKIKHYQCKKAIATVETKNENGKFTFEIEAWYTLEIPLPFGPKKYCGLPGVILELKDTHFSFFAKNIELNETAQVEILPFVSERMKKEF